MRDLGRSLRKGNTLGEKENKNEEVILWKLTGKGKNKTKQTRGKFQTLPDNTKQCKDKKVLLPDSRKKSTC